VHAWSSFVSGRSDRANHLARWILHFKPSFVGLRGQVVIEQRAIRGIRGGKLRVASAGARRAHRIPQRRANREERGSACGGYLLDRCRVVENKI
jgi:hypothetical protein